MLTVKYCSDKDVIEPLYRELSVEGGIFGTHFLFLDDDKPVGLWRMRFDGDGAAVADAIRFKSEVDIFDKNFFVRAILYKLSLGADVILKVKGNRPELKIFGFRFDGEDMAITTKDIALNACCKE